MMLPFHFKQLCLHAACDIVSTHHLTLQADIYQDDDDSRKDDIASLKVDQGDFKVFYDRVRDLKDYYRNRPIEVTEVSSTSLPRCSLMA